MADVRAKNHDDLLLRAAEAVNAGQLSMARQLAAQVLAEDAENLDASTLVATESQPAGEVRRLTVMFCDLVGSTALSERLDPELYRSVLSRYRRLATEIIEQRHGGHVASIKGDGILALFGYPAVHDNDTERGVQAGLDVAAAVAELSESTERSIGEPLAVRAAVHRGLLYIDPDEDDVYGLAANLCARLQDLAQPGTVVISEAVRNLVGHRFDTRAGEATTVKGVAEPVLPYTVLGGHLVRPARAMAPLFGRTQELAALQEAWDAACAGSDAKVAGIGLVGEPGIGKSRLATTFAETVAAQGARVVQLTASAEHGDVGFHPVRVLLEADCGITRDTPAPDRVLLLERELAALGFVTADVVPLLAPVLGLEPEHGYRMLGAEGRKLNEEITKAVFEYLIARFGDGPGLLLVEDHHWLDEPSRDLVGQVLRCGRDRTLVLATSRTPLPRALAEIVLAPLTTDACLALVDAIVPADASVGDRRELAERSDGIPLFLEELVASVDHEPVALKDRPARAAVSTVPDVLYEPLVARLYGLPSGVAVASAAATIGREVDLDLLAATVDVDQAELDLALDGLLGALVLERVDQGGSTVRFRHELVREVAYDLQPPSRRRELHGRVGDQLVEAASRAEVLDWSVVASHFERADRAGDAVDALDRASEEARRRGAVAEARLHLSRAIELVATIGASRARSQREVNLRLRRGYLTMTAEGAVSQAAAVDYERCLEVALSEAHGAEMISTLTSMWAYYTSRADLSQARLVSTTLRGVIDEGYEAWEPSNQAGFGMLDWFEGDFTGSVARLEAAMAALLGQDSSEMEAPEAWYVPVHPIVAMMIHLAIARFMDGDTVGAAEQYAAALARSNELEFPSGPWSWSYSAWLGTWMDIEQQRWDPTAATLEEMAAVCDRHGYDSFAMIGLTQSTAASSLRDLCDSRETRSSATQAAMLGSLVGAWEMLELRCMLSFYLTTLGALMADAGDVDGARERYDAALALAEATGMHCYDAETLRRRAHLDPATSVADLVTALELARSQGAKPFELRIALDLHDLRGSSGLDVLQRAVEGFRDTASYPELDDARARLATR
jgi:class 3 adenylate cyclase